MTHTELQTLMVEHGLNVKKTAALLYVSIGCVYKWKTGQRKIPSCAASLLKERLSQPTGKVLRLGDVWGIR